MCKFDYRGLQDASARARDISSRLRKRATIFDLITEHDLLSRPPFFPEILTKLYVVPAILHVQRSSEVAFCTRNRRRHIVYFTSEAILSSHEYKWQVI